MKRRRPIENLNSNVKKSKCDFVVMVHEWMSHVLRHDELPCSFDLGVVRDLLTCLVVMRDTDVKPHAQAVLHLTLHPITTSWLVFAGAAETIVSVLRQKPLHACRGVLVASFSAMVAGVETQNPLMQPRIHDFVLQTLCDTDETVQLYALHITRNSHCVKSHDVLTLVLPKLSSENASMQLEAATCFVTAARAGVDCSAFQPEILSVSRASTPGSNLRIELLGFWFLTLGWNDRASFVAHDGVSWLVETLTDDPSPKARDKTIMVLSHFVVGDLTLNATASMLSATKKLLLGKNVGVAMHAARFLSHFCSLGAVRDVLVLPELQEWMCAWMRTPRLVRVPDMHRYVSRLLLASNHVDVLLFTDQLKMQLGGEEKDLNHETIKELVRALLYSLRFSPEKNTTQVVSCVCAAIRVSVSTTRRWCWRLLGELVRREGIELKTFDPDVVVQAMRDVFENESSQTAEQALWFLMDSSMPTLHVGRNGETVARDVQRQKTLQSPTTVELELGATVKLHLNRDFLVGRVPYFSFLRGGWIDSEPKVKLQASPTVARDMVAFVVDATVSFDVETVAELLRVADFYCMDGWKHRIEWQLIQWVTKHSRFDVLETILTTVGTCVELPFVHLFQSICL